jgi:hypothetical protein
MLMELVVPNLAFFTVSWSTVEPHPEYTLSTLQFGLFASFY